jgi:hypothetical protein
VTEQPDNRTQPSHPTNRHHRHLHALGARATRQFVAAKRLGDETLAAAFLVDLKMAADLAVADIRADRSS